MKSMQSHRRSQGGFTILETLIAMTILAVLTTLAVGAYSDYTVRAQATEAMTLAAAVKTDIMEFHSRNGTFPTVSADIGLGSTSGRYVSSLSIQGGNIVVGYGNAASANLTAVGANLLAIMPAENADGQIAFFCGYEAQSLPAGWTGAGTFVTGQVDAKYLPGPCKA